MTRIVPRGEKRSINAGSTPSAGPPVAPDDALPDHTGARRRAGRGENPENVPGHRG
ncbi:hypothetical protein [Streptomyces puniciscabiei]|uniref:hypothetical protein n=1 Tax=Streptomyces puniciscabiei TaxID=164348 RepID=UPI0033207342